jgi:hypothetical protein
VTVKSIQINHHLSVEENHDDKTLTRLDLKLVLRDHFSLVQLFKMTESLFSRILLTYYFLQVSKAMMVCTFYSYYNAMHVGVSLSWLSCILRLHVKLASLSRCLYYICSDINVTLTVLLLAF